MLESYERECPNHSATIINIDFPALCSRDSLDDNDFDNFMFHLCAPGDSCSVRESVSSSFCYKKIHSQSFLPVLCTFFVVHFSFADDGGQNEASENKSKSDSLAAVERNDERKFKLLKIYESALL